MKTMLGPMPPVTDAVRARMIEEEAVRRQEEQRRAEERVVRRTETQETAADAEP